MKPLWWLLFLPLTFACGIWWGLLAGRKARQDAFMDGYRWGIRQVFGDQSTGGDV